MSEESGITPTLEISTTQIGDVQQRPQEIISCGRGGIFSQIHGTGPVTFGESCPAIGVDIGINTVRITKKSQFSLFVERVAD
eukprot:CAMPEP_0197827252 /NCGR_PEP_ID=MMETSP1437-20131217/4073_1 /TAXON_ID=49252 ORGANISM="Eucampia antarctica, Strain CCMP1452" /NCGR_SAMPLE_ID=MMETSP1437 /ASSEMBLY_ACC=CAM_ASM_001096 /LENGTH=81 /DNA_ID=CAMNT_0043428027 /DNA_START=198 /DNA_END=443 /DNA_ORIENTATION=+